MASESESLVCSCSELPANKQVAMHHPYSESHGVDKEIIWIADIWCFLYLRAIEKAIAPYYATVRPGYLSKLNSRGKVHEAGPISVDPKLLTMGSASTASELQKEFFQMLSCIGPYLHRDVLLLQKVLQFSCRMIYNQLNLQLEISFRISVSFHRSVLVV